MDTEPIGQEPTHKPKNEMRRNLFEIYPFTAQILELNGKTSCPIIRINFHIIIG